MNLTWDRKPAPSQLQDANSIPLLNKEIHWSQAATGLSVFSHIYKLYAAILAGRLKSANISELRVTDSEKTIVRAKPDTWRRECWTFSKLVRRMEVSYSSSGKSIRKREAKTYDDSSGEGRDTAGSASSDRGSL